MGGFFYWGEFVGKGKNSASAKPYYSASERKRFSKGFLPNSLPGTRYENELRRALDEIADNYQRSKALEEYAEGSFANGIPHLRVTYREESNDAYVQLGDKSAPVRFPSNFELTDKQKQALVEVYINRMYHSETAAERHAAEQAQANANGNLKVVSLDSFLAQRGLSSPISDYTLDTTRLPHGETARQKKKREAESLRVAREYQQKRREAINEYNRRVEAGEFRAPTKIEEMQRTARGNPENASVQAARRALKKRGLTW